MTKAESMLGSHQSEGVLDGVPEVTRVGLGATALPDLSPFEQQIVRDYQIYLLEKNKKRPRDGKWGTAARTTRHLGMFS